MAKKFDIIMLNMSSYAEWEEGVSNRNYHILQQLLNSDQVGKILAVDYLPLNWKRGLRNFKENIWLNLNQGEVLKKRLTTKVTKVSEKLYVYSDVRFFYNPKAVFKNIKRVALNLNFGDVVLWSFYPLAAPYWHELGQKLTVFEAVDNWLNHPSYQKYSSQLSASYKIIKDQADLIFTVSKNLVNFFEDQSNVFWIPNGVDLKHYTQKFPLTNRDIAELPKPIIGYIGVIEKRVDLPLIKFLAEKNPDKSFVLVGSVWNEQDKVRQELETLPNIYFLGYKTYQEAPMYIQQFDVGLIPHVTGEFSASTNPMKMYEYLACGKPVVASKGSGAEHLADWVLLAEGGEEFDKQIKQALNNDSPSLQLARQEFVKQYSWLSTVNKMLDLINNKLS